MEKRRRLLLRILLTCILVLGMLPVSALADGTEKDEPTTPHTHTSSKEACSKEATCEEAGYKEYWQCEQEDCGVYFYKKSAGFTSQVVEIENLEEWKKKPGDEGGYLPALGHEMDKKESFPAKEPNCVEKGHKAYWKCKNCGQYFYTEENEIHKIGDETALKEWLEKDGSIPVDGKKHKSGNTYDGEEITKAECNDKEKKTGTIQNVIMCGHCQKKIMDKPEEPEIIPAIASIEFKNVTHEYNGKNYGVPKVVVKDTEGETIPEADYDVKVASKQNLKDIGKKTIQITFKKECKRYTGTATTTKGTYEVIPPKEYTLTLGGKLKISDLVGSTKTTFISKEFNKISKKYGLTLSKDKKTIKTSVSKIKVDKVKQTFNVKYTINKKTYTTKVKLVFAAPTFKVKKDKKDNKYSVYVSYNYPTSNKFKIKIRIDGESSVNKVFDKYTKKKKYNKFKFVKVSEKTAKKHEYELKFITTLTCKGWKLEPITKKVSLKVK